MDGSLTCFIATAMLDNSVDMLYSSNLYSELSHSFKSRFYTKYDENQTLSKTYKNTKINIMQAIHHK